MQTLIITKMTRNLLPLLLLFSAVNAHAGNKIKAYFNNPVNNSVSKGVNAVYLPSGTMGDTIVAYINRAKYTLDIAQYDYNQDTWNGPYANIAAAVNNAYSRGVTVRWIYDGSSSNTGLSLLDSAIQTLGRPSGGSGIMHNKFMVIDANSADPTNPIVFTGSPDWSSEMMYKDYNNILFFQDSALAFAYTAEFNMMWGSVTDTPNATLAKFGPAKTDLGLHTFYIDGNLVELYFSPSDETNNHILDAISSANTDLYVGMYCFTEGSDATNIVTKNTSGLYTLCIVDQYTHSSSPGVYNTLSTGLGSAGLKEYTGSYIYHNKMMIIDPSDTCSDPQVLTGSHNWTSSANNYNDENTVIIHNDTMANIYYQSFYANFTSLGGSPVAITVSGCGDSAHNSTAILPVAGVENNFTLFPNPSTGEVNISYQLTGQQQVSVKVFNIIGSLVADLADNEIQNAALHTYNIILDHPGIYFASLIFGNEHYTKKIVITGK